MTVRSVLRLAALLFLSACLLACTANPALEESRQAFASGNTEAALRSLRDKVAADPRNLELRSYYLRQRDMLVVRQLAVAEQARAAGRYEEAEAALAMARQFDPLHPRVRAGLDASAARQSRDQTAREAQRRADKGDVAGAEAAARAVLATDASHPLAREVMRRLDERAAARDPLPAALGGALAKPVTVEFRDAPLRGVLEVLSRESGLNFVLDKDVRPDIKVSIFVRKSSIDDVLKLLMVTQQLDRKLLNERSVLIYPNTPAKQKDYQELVTRSFYLANADPKQAMAMIKQMVKTKDVFVEEKLNLLVMKDTPDAVRLAERLIAGLDLAEPEVMLEVEVMEISRNRLLELGLRFPEQIGYGLLQPTTTSAVTTTTGTTITQNLGGQLLSGNINLRNTGAMVPYVANPGLLLNLKDQDGRSNILANPRIRVKNRDKARIHIGEKLPVFTTTSTANVGVSASVNYLDVGLKLEVEPTVHLDDEVAIKVNLEVSSIVKEVLGPSSSLAYQVGTRSAVTSLRLRDGETQVLAGLISDEERSSAYRLPGLGEVPGLGRLFSSQRDVDNKTEIVLLITPRVVRNLTQPAQAGATQAAGTEAAVGAAPLLLGPGGAAAVAPRGAGAGASGGPPSAPVPAVAVDAGLPALAVAVPEQVQAGETFAVTLTLAGPATEGGPVLLAYDSTLVEALDQPGEGADALALQLPAGTAPRLTVRFRARPGAAGLASFGVLSAQLRGGGQVQTLPSAEPVGVRIAP
ncbi:secretin N-terminal domain-containing protein [Zoogloea sp.]|jgi:general secretion pathway protein D|uniref:secretin N-terminal domain-containing protein n=2 Tax=Zoogloea sp. TaxID=49181 RepID=UPI001B4F6D38|nr:secretin N-terminal domain-containing protein [Zoogloea sp.]MBK6653843.1 general secretion pathway protein GspD [Zoogloea sp.]MBP7445123.1 general secretion pathway protein GspD [Zoogloea sp.]